jgi:hypothetical protein
VADVFGKVDELGEVEVEGMTGRLIDVLSIEHAG